MSIIAECSCGKRYRVGPEKAGSLMKCPACGQIVSVPTEFTTSTDPPVAPPLPPRRRATPEPHLPQRRRRDNSERGRRDHPERSRRDNSDRGRRTVGIIKLTLVVVLLLFVLGIETVVIYANLAFWAMQRDPANPAGQIPWGLPIVFAVAATIAGRWVRGFGCLGKAIYLLGFTGLLPGWLIMKTWDAFDEAWAQAFD